MPDEDNNFGGSLVLDFRKWWRHVKTINKLNTQQANSKSCTYLWKYALNPEKLLHS